MTHTLEGARTTWLGNSGDFQMLGPPGGSCSLTHSGMAIGAVGPWHRTAAATTVRLT